MLPKNYHNGDETWLKERFEELVSRTGINHSKVVAEKYSIVYADVFERTEEQHKKANMARHEANQRLVRLIKSIGAKGQQPTA